MKLLSSLVSGFILLIQSFISQIPGFTTFHSPSEIIGSKQVITTSDVLFKRINRYRQSENLPLFAAESESCHLYQQVLSADSTQTNVNISSLCKNCTRGSLIKISQLGTVETILASLLQDQTVKDTFTSLDLNQLCVSSAKNEFIIIISSSQTPTPQSSPSFTKIVTPKKVIKNFTHDELINGLNNYRVSHKLPQLEKDDKLCQYAHSRVEELIDKFHTTSQSEYPNPDKYPLDAHAGFIRDAESNFVFDLTGYPHIAENLAYWPDVDYAHQVIEWGWDSSTEGHRETQLSTEYSRVCIEGRDGFFVAIFAR
jgi:uncharacterized protein YkwD